MKRIVLVGALLLPGLSLSLPAVAARDVIYSGIDTWTTRGDGRTYTDFKLEPVPAGFFCASSEPFDGRITFQGAPIAAGEGHELKRTDTIIHRLDDAVFNKRGLAETRIQVSALSLVSIEPIQTSCGQFNVKAVLNGEQPVTRMRIVREGAKGGYFVAPLALNVKLLFTPVDRPNARPRVLTQEVRFNSNPPQPWARDAAGRAFVHEEAVKVDTDGDGKPDTLLPGTSNFVAGLGQTKLSVDCHYYYEEGFRKVHCPGVLEP